MRFFIFISVFVFFASGFAGAGELDRGAIPFKAEGTIITTSPVRDAPPHGPLNLFVGKEIKSTEQNTTVKIIGKKNYGGFSGTNIWYQVESVNGLEATKDRPLWVFGGTEGKAQQIIVNEKKGEENGN